MSFWATEAENRIKKIIAAYISDEEKADKMFNEIDDVVSDIRWEAQEDGRYNESFNHVCNSVFD